MAATLAELTHHRLIGFDAETPFLRAAQKALPAWRRDRFAVRSDSDVAQLAFIRAGAGIGICQDALARRSAPARAQSADRATEPEPARSRKR